MQHHAFIVIVVAALFLSQWQIGQCPATSIILQSLLTQAHSSLSPADANPATANPVPGAGGIIAGDDFPYYNPGHFCCMVITDYRLNKTDPKTNFYGQNPTKCTAVFSPCVPASISDCVNHVRHVFVSSSFFSDNVVVGMRVHDRRIVA